MTKKNKFNKLSETFIGKQADDLSNLIREQVKPIYLFLGIVVPVKSCSIIHYLNKYDNLSVTELAKHLKQSHQLVKQKLPKLIQLELITTQADKNDKRRTTYHLTGSGKSQAQLLQNNSLKDVYENLFDEIGANLHLVINQAINGLKNKDLLTRFNETKK